MTSKNLFFKLMVEDIKRRLWAVCLAFLTFFFWLPVSAAMGLSNLARDVARWQAYGKVFEGSSLEAERYKSLISLAEDVVSINPLVAMTVVGAAVILGLTGFSFLHNKSKVDFYHSAPVKRELLFLVKYVDGVLIVFSMYFLNLLIACGLFAVNGAGFGTVLPPGFSMLLVHLAGFLLFYTLTVIAVLMTGNFIISVLGTIVFFAYVPVAATLLMMLAELFFMTNNISGSFWLDLMTHGSPVPYYITLISQAGELEFNQMFLMLPKLVFPLAVSAALLVFCLFLYRARPSEAAGKAMAFKLSKAPIKALLVVPLTIYMALFFWSIYSSLAWGIFGFLFGLIVTHCVIEIIYHFDFRKLFSNPHHAVVCGLLALALIGVYRFDLVGYDSYLPSKGKFASAAMKCGGLRDWDEYGIPEKIDGYWKEWMYIDESDYVRSHMAVIDYDAVKAIAEAGIEDAKNEKKMRMTQSDDYSDYYRKTDSGGDGKIPTEYLTSVEMTYRLKSGRTVSRRYRVDVAALRDSFDRLYTTGEYKSGVYPVLSYEPENLTGLYSIKNQRISEVRADAASRAEILKAYQKEMTALTLKQRQEETPVAALRFQTEAELEYLKAVSAERSAADGQKSYEGDFRLEDMRDVNFFPVYPSFTETIGLLKQSGADVTALPDISDIGYIKIWNRYEWTAADSSDDSIVPLESEAYSGNATRDYNEGGDYRQITISNDSAQNREMIEQILGTLVAQDCVSRNGLQKFNTNLTVQIYLNSVNAGRNEDQKVYDNYLFKDNILPEFLVEPLHYDQVPESLIIDNTNYGLNVAAE